MYLFSPNNFDSIKTLNDFLPENRTITTLIFKDKLPDSFSDFKNVFLSSDNARMISSFKFINSNFSIQNVNDLSKIIRNRTIRTLHIIKSLNALTLKPFIQKVYDNPGFQSITSLSLDHTQSIDIRTLMPYLKNVVSLTLIHCEFEIADLFDVLTVDYQMTSLNISQNNNDKQIFNAIIFPRYLSNIIIRDVKWELLSLNNFIEFSMRHSPQPIDEDNGTGKVNSYGENELKLDLSQIEMDDDYWKRFFDGLEEKPRGRVASLRWDDNPIDKRFVSFINSFLNLTTLSLNGFFIIDGDEGLESLLQFIAKSDTLQSVSIAGTELKTLGITTLDIIDTLYINRSIKRIDISNHECGNNLLIKLMDVLIDNKVVEEIKINKNDLNDIKLFEQFFIEIGKNRGKPLFTEFIDRFKNYGNSNNDDENVDDLEYIGDVSYCCEDALLSTKLVNVYKEDGTVQTKNFCRRCIRDSLVYALGRMYDENTDTPIMNRIFDNNDFINPISLLFSQEENPFIPMGQLIWSFIFDSDIATPARTSVRFHF